MRALLAASGAFFVPFSINCDHPRNEMLTAELPQAQEPGPSTSIPSETSLPKDETILRIEIREFDLLHSTQQVILCLERFL